MMEGERESIWDISNIAKILPREALNIYNYSDYIFSFREIM